jgi:thioredoxin reductase
VSAPDLTTSCVVIGAGQAGLSVAFYLRRLGLEPGEEFVVLDRGPRTGGAWQHRWEALRLGSAHRVNDLPGMDELGLSFETADHHAPARDVVADYYAQYEEHYGLQVVRPASVTRVEDLGGPLLVRFDTENGPLELAGSTIVNATGTWGSPFVPHYPGIREFEGRHVHTAEYTDATDFTDQDVVVVGAGTSAIGFILELEPHARSITWATRRPPQFLDEAVLNLEAAEKAVRSGAAEHRERHGRAPHAAHPGGGRSGRARVSADVRPHRAGRCSLGRVRRLPAGAGDRVGDGLPPRAAAPRPPQAAREGGRRDRREPPLGARSARLLRRLRARCLDHRREPGRAQHRAAGRRDAQQDGTVGMDLITIVLIVTPIVLGVILLVIGVIFFTVVIPPTRQKLAERRAADAAEREASESSDE